MTEHTPTASDTEVEFEIDGRRVEPGLCRITLGDSSTKLEPKVMDLLIYFAQRPGKLLSREELEESVWQDMVVGYDALSNAIIKLRKAFQDDARHPRVIETVSKRGYRLIADARQVDHVREPQNNATTGQVGTGNKARPPTSPRPRPLIIGLTAGTLLLIVVIGMGAWFVFSEPRPLPLEPHVTQVETTDPEAEDAFLKGWTHYRRHTPEDFSISMVHFQRAILLDPEFGRAYAALAAVYWRAWQRHWHHRLGMTPRLQAWRNAQSFLDKSAIRPTPLAHQIASEMLSTNRRFDEAIREAEKAVELNANDPAGHVALANALTFAGRAEEAAKHVQKAMRIDPDYSASLLLAQGRVAFSRENYDEAALALEQAKRHNTNSYIPYVLLIASYGHLGKKQQANKAIAAVNSLRHELRQQTVSASTPNDPWDRWPYQYDADLERVSVGLRAAGLPNW